MAADNRPALRAELLEYLARVPPKINDGSFDLSVRFKADVVKYRKLAKKPQATEAELSSAINQMHSYW